MQRFLARRIPDPVVLGQAALLRPSRRSRLSRVGSGCSSDGPPGQQGQEQVIKTCNCIQIQCH